MAHMDELSLIVKRVEPDGTLHVAQLGTMYPGNFGLGPVSVLGDDETSCGVITLGSEHTTKESQRIYLDVIESAQESYQGTLEATTAIRIYGTPTEGIPTALRRSTGPGVPIRILPAHLGGFALD
jgi:putative aminopeptidase FrvX